MNRSISSTLSSRRSNAERQRRWRQRQRARQQAADQLREQLGRPPTDEELWRAVEMQLAELGLETGQQAGIREVPLSAGLGAQPRMHPSASQLDGVPDDVDDRGALPEPGAEPVRWLAEAAIEGSNIPAVDPGQMERAAAIASVGFELRVATARERIFKLLMASAEKGDVASLLFLGSRLAPAARPKRFISVPELQNCDLGTSDGVQRAMELVVKQVASGALALDDAEMLLRTLEKRLAAAEQVARAEAYRAPRR